MLILSDDGQIKNQSKMSIMLFTLKVRENETVLYIPFSSKKTLTTFD